jgi:NTP pyrophosphatase (non-canonical NTP hydrolase)
MPIDNLQASAYDAYQQRHRAEAQPTGQPMNQTNEQRPFDYIAEAHLTASPHFYGDRVPLAHFGEVLQQAIVALSALDRVKKCLFYGRELGPLAEGVETGEVYQNCAKLPEWISSHPDEDAKACNIIHAIIGKATEAGELLEALHATAINGETFDVANAGEEIGDGFWYDALLARACGLTFDGIQRTNIAKLRHRFPDRFTEYDANNRDLFGERRILEEGEKISS